MGGKKIIGVCLTKIHDNIRTDYLKALYTACEGTDYKIIVFNSPLDLYNNDRYDEGASSVYKMINYELIDALVVFYGAFCNKQVVSDIIDGAKKNRVPVVFVHGEDDGCYCIKKDSMTAYEKVIRHIIFDHDVDDCFFLAGVKGEENSENRLKCLRKVLSEKGIDLTDDMIGYGDYWSWPTTEVIDKLVEQGKKRPPKAIICANDSMATTACERLKEYGFKAPDDYIITGFDGLEVAELYYPRLTTCKEDMPALGRMTVSIIGDALERNVPPKTYIEEYAPVIGESCGCRCDDISEHRARSCQLFQLIEDMEDHETYMFTWVDRVLKNENMESFGWVLSEYALPNSYVCLNSDFVSEAVSGIELKKTLPSEELVIYASKKYDYSVGDMERYKVSDMVPHLEDWLGDDTMCIINSIYVENEVCGYYVIKTAYISEAAHKINRLVRIMNIAFSTVLSRLRQRHLRTSIENANYTDPVTKLPNLKGLTKWFNEFSAVPANHNKRIAFSIYSVAQYKFIYENYGIHDIEDALLLVGNGLVSSNPEGTVVAHTAEDEFVVINIVDDTENIGDIINVAVRKFYGIIENYNDNNGKEYYVEVNCGCTVANPGWRETLQSFIKVASGEMYINRIKMGKGPVLKEKRSPKDLYNAFNLLVEKNLFTYNYQPIVDAKTGDIYAYEALMRTTGGILMSPLEVLEIAAEYKRLYEVEKATLFNVFNYYSENIEKFGNSKIFINTIPGVILTDEDNNFLEEKYGKYMGRCVFEITEQNALTDEELIQIRDFGGGGSQLAVDDYGTGHSNIVNLIRYSPQIIKIDRFLITNIQEDVNKQMFVKSAIEFANMNNIRVVAEGVETIEELQTVIGFGVDLIQGYYTARPAPEPIGELPENIRNEIIMANSSRLETAE